MRSKRSDSVKDAAVVSAARAAYAASVTSPKKVSYVAIKRSVRSTLVEQLEATGKSSTEAVAMVDEALPAGGEIKTRQKRALSETLTELMEAHVAEELRSSGNRTDSSSLPEPERLSLLRGSSLSLDGSATSSRRGSADSAQSVGTAAINDGLDQFKAELAAGTISQSEYDHIVAISAEGYARHAEEENALEAAKETLAREAASREAAAEATAAAEANAASAEAGDGGATTSAATSPPSPAPKPAAAVTSESFLWGTKLGTGGFATVVHCRHKESGSEYACKVMRKDFIKRHQKMKCVCVRTSCAPPQQHLISNARERKGR